MIIQMDAPSPPSSFSFFFLSEVWVYSCVFDLLHVDIENVRCVVIQETAFFHGCYISIENSHARYSMCWIFLMPSRLSRRDEEFNCIAYPSSGGCHTTRSCAQGSEEFSIKAWYQSKAAAAKHWLELKCTLLQIWHNSYKKSKTKRRTWREMWRTCACNRLAASLIPPSSLANEPSLLRSSFD